MRAFAVDANGAAVSAVVAGDGIVLKYWRSFHTEADRAAAIGGVVTKDHIVNRQRAAGDGRPRHPGGRCYTRKDVAGADWVGLPLTTTNPPRVRDIRVHIVLDEVTLHGHMIPADHQCPPVIVKMTAADKRLLDVWIDDQGLYRGLPLNSLCTMLPFVVCAADAHSAVIAGAAHPAYQAVC